MSIDKKDFWKRKLMAYLHDPPHKPYGIANHEETINSNLNVFGLSKEDMLGFEKQSDRIAAAADRFSFPNPRKQWEGEYLKTDWKKEGLPFIHPFCGNVLKPDEFPATRDVAEGWMSCALERSILKQEANYENFLMCWRLWEKNLISEYSNSGLYMPYLVADTRIPDHSIWQHNSLVSALEGCGKSPAFLIFQIGPVQSFIGQAKKTQDLWAGSYLLSFLNAIAISVIIKEYGPDHLIFPQIKGNPIIDKLLWDVYGKDLEITSEAFKNWRRTQLLIPSLPNRFLALISAEDSEIKEKIDQAVKAEWEKISDSVHGYLNKHFKFSGISQKYTDWDCLWKEQISAFPRIDIHIEPFENPEKILNDFKQGHPPYENPANHSVSQNYDWAVNMPDEFKDSRNYAVNDLKKIDNPGFAWSLNYMKTEWKFGAFRNSRRFKQRFEFKEYKSEKRHIEKDPLDGVNEVLGGKNYKDFWKALSEDKDLGEKGKRYFVGKQRYGALSVIKRLFDSAYLTDVYNFDVHRENSIKSTYEIATGRKIECEDEESALLTDKDCKYYAVICLDGDNMGKWVSGENAQLLKEQLSGNAIKCFFEKSCKNKDELKRAVTPSYHLAFSEALSNFANYCVEPIICNFDGQLIYAGGDDVMAIVPVDNVISCAEALQFAFRGVKPTDKSSKTFKVLEDVFDYDWSEMQRLSHTDGFLKLKNPGSARPKHPMLMPGPKSTVSVGIAIGHIKSPMQDIIQAARESEKKAKDAGKDGFYLEIMKRSGEAHGFFTHWNHNNQDAKWQTEETRKYSQFLSVWQELWNNPQMSDSSNALPYIYTQMIIKLLNDFKGKYHCKFDEDMIAACEEFLRIVLNRQAGLKEQKAEGEAKRLIGKFNLKNSSPENYINFWKSYAFIKRISKGGGE